VIGLVIVGQGVFAVAVIAAILLASRVLLAWVGANPFSWLSYNLTRVTEPIVRPFKHPLSGRIPRYDLVPLVAAVLVLMNGLFIMGLLRQLAEILGRLGGDILTGNATAAVVVSELIRLTGWVLVALIFLRFLLPFLGVSYASRFMRLLYKLTEPVLEPLRRPLRRLIGAATVFDFTALVAVFLVWIATELVAGIAESILR
jgi:YggT family protein